MYCRRCGASLHQGVVICPECGARQRRRATSVRCAHCGGHAALELEMCPHCGRNLRPAGPRWGWWLAGFMAVALIGLWGLGKLPVERILQEAEAVRGRLAGLVEILGPATSVDSGTPTPEQTPQLLAQATSQPTPTANLAESEPTITAAPEDEEGEASPPAVTETPEESPADTLTPSSPMTITVTATVIGATRTPTVAITTPPTASPSPTSTVTPAPTATAVPPTLTRPAPTATRGAAAGGSTTYRVQPGDTLSTIAAQFGVSWQAVASANGLTADSLLQIGQALVIPVPGAALPPTNTPRPRATPTPTKLPASPVPALAPPVLSSPGDRGSFSGGDAFIELVWQPATGIMAGNQYQVTMRWTEQGSTQEHAWFTTATSSRVPLWLWGRADQPSRQYAWLVRVVQVTTDGQGGERIISLSPPSEERTFYWN